MIRAISPPKVKFNPTTNTWDVPERPDLTTAQVKKPVAPCKPVFSGDKAPIRALWWNDVMADTPKCWKHQSVRTRQYRLK